MKPFVLAILLFGSANLPAEAHRLKVFATVEGGSVSGYAFFVGGGRPEKAILIVKDKSGEELYRGKTDNNGAFNWHPKKSQTMTIIVNAGDGHMAQATLDGDRFDPAGASGVMSSPVRAVVGEKSSSAAPLKPVCSTSAEIEALVDRSVDRAVSRQVRPLLEAFSVADTRIRFNDIVGGIGMIFGLAGVAMWMSSRRSVDLRRRSAEDYKADTERRV
jgi:nickel transport protein